MVFDQEGDVLGIEKYYSIGGGFVIEERKDHQHGDNVFYRKDFGKQEGQPQESTLNLRTQQDCISAALPFQNANHLLELCEEHQMYFILDK